MRLKYMTHFWGSTGAGLATFGALAGLGTSIPVSVAIAALVILLSMFIMILSEFMSLSMEVDKQMASLMYETRHDIMGRQHTADKVLTKHMVEYAIFSKRFKKIKETNDADIQPLQQDG